MSELFTHSPFPEQAKGPDPAQPADAPLVPPPPQESMEVTIRTMASDLELMAKGGVMPPPAVTVVPISTPVPSKPSSNLRAVLWTAGILVAAAAALGAGYFLLPLLLPAAGTDKPVPTQRTEAPAASSTQAEAPPAARFVHASYFRRAPDAKITVDLKSGDGSEQYTEALARALAGTPAANFIEAEIKRGGQPLSFTEFARIAGITVPEENFWSSRLEEDFTMFILRENDGYWPGYVLKRRESESALLVKNALRRIEDERERLPGFFLTEPGVPAEEFTDTQIGGQPFRRLLFSEKSAALIYGWIYNNYFLISTSETGFKRALEQF